MDVLGITFVGTRTAERAAMSSFVTDVLGLTPTDARGMDAAVFALRDGSTFVVTSSDGPDDLERTVGFVVSDIDAALAELRAAGIETDDEVATNDRQRYVHFRAPDGHLYELIEDLD